MGATATAAIESRVLVLMPTAKDAERTGRALADAGIPFTICHDLAELCRQMRIGAATALFHEEAIAGGQRVVLEECLRDQPPWSDLPLVVLARETQSSGNQPLRESMNVTLLDRPVRFRSLVSVLRATLRARYRQYDVRNYMVEQQKAGDLLQFERERYRTTLASIGDAVIATDTRGVITFLNHAAEQMTGWQFDKAAGRPLEEIFRILNEIDRQPVPNPATGALQEGANVGLANPTILIARDGSERPVENSAAPIRDGSGEMIGAILVFRDITDRRNAESALRESNRRKDDFIAVLAHELRNPLAPLRNGLRVIRLAADDPAAVARAREMMDRQLDHMVRLIDDLLDASRISQNKMELRRERVSLTDVLETAIETARPLIDAAEIDLTVSLPATPIYLNADITRLAQVFSNLLTNSTKYSSRGGRIWLSAENHAGHVVISVRDDGIGIPAESLTNIFDMFSQVDRSLERSAGGLGIGLALVKGLVEMHGGSVTASSKGLGQGSTFSVTLPTLVGSEVGSRAPEDVPHFSHFQRRTLIVDDNIDGAESMAMMLRIEGDEVFTANDGMEALQVSESVRPQVILMDVGMPRLNGLDATREIRKKPWAEKTIIIALTGWGQEPDRQRSIEAGCNGHLVKPVQFADLERLLKDLTGESEG